MDARIYQPTKNAMQSGKSNTRKWILEFERAGTAQSDPLMGWVGGGDVRNQLQLTFGTREEAISYAERNGLDFVVSEPNVRAVKGRSYSDNFSFSRVR